MTLGLSVGRPSDEKVATFLAEQKQLDPSYADIGATRTGGAPRGFTIDHFSVELGRGDAVFQRAKDGLRHWAAHRGSGVQVEPPDAVVREGETVALVVRTGGIYMLASCRVVWTLDEPDAFGFGYGTMPGHPESGEESFVVRRRGDTVVFEVDAFSRPRHLVAKLGGPITRALQVQATKRYLTAMQKWCS